MADDRIGGAVSGPGEAAAVTRLGLQIGDTLHDIYIGLNHFSTCRIQSIDRDTGRIQLDQIKRSGSAMIWTGGVNASALERELLNPSSGTKPRHVAGKPCLLGGL